MLKRRFIPLPVISLAIAAHVRADTFVSNPFRGVTHYERHETSPRQLVMHILEIDLSDPGLRFITTSSNGALPGEVIGATTRTFMTQQNAQMAINTGFFASAGSGTNSQGQQEFYRDLSHIAVSDGQPVSPWSGSGSTREAALNITQANIASIVRPGNVNVADFSTNPGGVALWTTVGGNERMLAGGNVVATDTVLHPRTCAGVKGSTLYLFVVDGRQTGWSDGMNLVEISNLLKNDYGVTDAVNLDGGGSTTMAFANPVPHVLNRPSDGTERLVGNSLAVFAVPSPQWYVDAPGNWSSAGNWAGGVPNAPGAVANFADAIRAPRTVNLNVPVAVGTINLQNANGYTLAGGSTITLDAVSGAAGINCSYPAAHLISAPLALADATTLNVVVGCTLNISSALNNAAGHAITRSGSGLLQISGSQSHGVGASFAANGGTTNFNSNAGAGGANLTISVSSAASINFNVSQSLASMIVSSGGTARLSANGSRLLITRAESTSGTAKIDVADNQMIIDYTGASPIASVLAQLTSGYAGGAWNGNGIMTSSAAANFDLGVAEATDLFKSFPASFVAQSIDSTSVLIRYTRAGDATLDEIVDTVDFNALASGFGQTGRRWSHGDFNYSGTVDTADFNLLAANFGQSMPGAAGAQVPEPGSAGFVVMLSAAGILMRRVRRRKERDGP
jgi:exopolysaccharide biosynthesis protein